MFPPPMPPSQPIQDRWGEGLAAGFVVLPVLLLRHQKDLGIDDGAMVVLLNVLGSWWYEGKLPYLSGTTIAGRMGVAPRTVQRHLQKLERLGLLSRAGSVEVAANDWRTSYSPAGLVAELQRRGNEFKRRRPASVSAEGDIDI